MNDPGHSGGGGRHAAPSALVSSLYVLALALPGALLLQRQNWALPHTGLGSGLGLVTALLMVGATVALLASGTLPPIPRDNPVPRLLLLWTCLVYASYFAWALSGNHIAPLFADLGLAQITLEALFVLGLMAALRVERRLWRFIKMLVLCGGIYSAILLVTAAVGDEIAERLRIPVLVVAGDLAGVEAVRAGFIRPQGMAGHPLESGSVAAALVPIGLALTVGLASRRYPYKFWAAATIVTALGALSTMSRSATIALIAAMCAMGLRWPFPVLVRAAVGSVAAVLVAAAAFPDRAGAYLGLFQLDAGSDSSLFSRQQAREHVADVLATHFWVGEGMGTQAALGRPILDNQYLGFAVEMGVPALLAWVALMAVPILFCLQRSSSLPARRKHLALGVAGSLTALAVIFAILDAFAFPQIRLLTYILLGLVGPVCTAIGDPGPDAEPAALAAAATPAPYQPQHRRE